MNSLLSYSGIATKIRAMESRLLKKEDFQVLSEMTDIPRAVAHLSKFPAYNNLFSELDPSLLHRGKIEGMLMVTLYQDFAKIYRFCSLSQRRILDLYFRKYEVAVLKKVLRKIFNPGNEMQERIIQLGIFQKHTVIDVTRLAEVSTISEFLDALKGTEYYAPLSKLENSDRQTLFDYEMTLDLFYFSTIWAQKKRLLKGPELDMISRSYGSNIDMLNLMWIFRAKMYYQMPQADIFALLIPIQYRLHDAEIQKMVTASDIKELKDVIQKTYYAKGFEELNGKNLESLYRQILEKIYTTDKRRNPYSIAAITSYLYAKEQEIDRLTTVLECVRYGLPSGETLEYIR